MTNKETVKFVVDGGRLECPSACPRDVYDSVLLQCWQADPAKRPTFKEIFDKLAKFEENYKKPAIPQDLGYMYKTMAEEEGASEGAHIIKFHN
jgi:hypothetical protein